LRFSRNRVDVEKSRREQLLALLSLRRNLESGTARRSTSTAVGTMRRDMRSAESASTRIIRELHELIAALDRRVPQVQRAGEVSIAKAAAGLKAEALRRIAELERRPAPASSR
jgi:hypothetical protein